MESLLLHFSNWREKHLKALSKQIQEKFYTSQSPPKTECQKVRKVRCSTSLAGIGSQIHQLMSCLMSGYFTGTLVIIDQIFDNYLYNSSHKWDHYFSPISDSCQPFSNNSYPRNVFDIDIRLNGISKQT